jgi:uncharacterized membrane protein YqgA involved in biofilm formation
MKKENLMYLFGLLLIFISSFIYDNIIWNVRNMLYVVIIYIAGCLIGYSAKIKENNGRNQKN